MITLLEQSVPRYRLRGLKLTHALLDYTPVELICRTGIDSLLQNVNCYAFCFSVSAREKLITKWGYLNHHRL